MLAKYFEERKVVFRAPEYRKVTLLVLTPDELAVRIEISDADAEEGLRRTARARYVTPERRQVQQIVFPNADEARAAADKLAQGTTFAALAAERGLKDSDIDLGTVAKIGDGRPRGRRRRLRAQGRRGQRAGRRAASAPRSSRSSKIEPGKTRPFEEVAAELKRDLATERAKNEVTNVQDKIEDERARRRARSPTRRRSSTSSRAPSRRSTAPAAMPDGNAGPDLPQGVDVLPRRLPAESAARTIRCSCRAAAMSGSTSTTITPSRERPLDEVKDQVEARWRDDEIGDAAARPRPTEMLDKLKAGTSLADVAAAEQPQGRMATGPQARRAAASAVAAQRVDGDFPHRQGRGRQRRGRERRPSGSCSASPRSAVPPLDPQAADAKRIDDALRARIADDLIGAVYRHGCRPTSASPSIRAR